MRLILFIKSYLLALVLLPVTVVCAAEEANPEGKELPPMVPLQATWKFSQDQGKTYTLDALSGGNKIETIGRAEFQIDDPAKIGMLWFGTKATGGGVTPVNSYVVGGRYIVRPLVLEEAKLEVNGKPVDPEMPGNTLYERMGIDPLLLHKGANVLTFRGQSLARDACPVEYCLTTSPADVLELRNGPVLGPVGLPVGDAGYFTLTCRTYIPCQIEVRVKPVDPVGQEKSYSFARGTIHHAKVPLPNGTRKFHYTVVASNGSCTKASAGFDVRVPDPEQGLKFVVLGQTAANTGTTGLATAARILLDLDPDFIIHTGSMVVYAYWDVMWDVQFFPALKDLLAHKPLCAVPSYKDCYSQQFAHMLYYPTDDGLWNHWTWAIGPVRFIGVDGLYAAADGENTAKWFEEVLRGANEDFLFDVTSYPAYTTNPFGRGQKGHDFDKEVLHPLLARYKATASLGCTGKYEYIAAPNDSSVPSIITGGVGSPMAPGWLKYQYCVFEIRNGRCDVTAVAYETGEVLDRQSFPARKVQ